MESCQGVGTYLFIFLYLSVIASRQEWQSLQDEPKWYQYASMRLLRLRPRNDIKTLDCRFQRSRDRNDNSLFQSFFG